MLFKQEWVGPSTPILSHLRAGTMDTAENLPRAAFHPQRTDPPVISDPPPPAAIVDNGPRMADMSIAESVSSIQSSMHSSSWIAAARGLRGQEAQGLINLIDRVSGT